MGRTVRRGHYKKKSKVVVSSKERTSYSAAYLDCQNVKSCGKWVLHKFVKSIVHSDDDKCFDLIYCCVHCGAGRVWGNSTSYVKPVVNRVDNQDV